MSQRLIEIPFGGRGGGGLLLAVELPTLLLDIAWTLHRFWISVSCRDI